MGREIKAKERGRRLTSSSKGEEDSGLVDWNAGECSTERNFGRTENAKLRKWIKVNYL